MHDNNNHIIPFKEQQEKIRLSFWWGVNGSYQDCTAEKWDWEDRNIRFGRQSWQINSYWICASFCLRNVALITPLVFKQSSPLISEGYPAWKNQCQEMSFCIYLLWFDSWLLITTNANKAKCQKSVSVNVRQEFPGKTHMSLLKYLILQ